MVALTALPREMAADFGPLGVRVNAIAPGEIDTASLGFGTDKLVETPPMCRLGLPAEVAKAIYYLYTDQPSYVPAPNCTSTVGSTFRPHFS